MNIGDVVLFKSGEDPNEVPVDAVVVHIYETGKLKLSVPFGDSARIVDRVSQSVGTFKPFSWQEKV